MVSVHYGNVISEDIHGGIVGVCPDAADFSESNIQTILENNAEPNYISFDGLGIDLDNKYKTFINHQKYKGYCSNSLSDENCNIASNNNYINLKNNNPVNAPITIKFNGDCCRELVVAFTYEDSHNEYEYVDCNGELVVIHPPLMDNYYSVRISYLKTAEPNQRIKISYIKFGEMVELNNLKSVELLEEINVLSDDLPINSFNFSANVPENVELKNGNTINVYSNSKYYGTFYLEDYQKISRGIYQISALNSISILDNTEFKSWDFSVINARSFLREISKSTKIIVQYAEQINISDLYVFGYLPISTNRVALCGYCFASDLMVDSSRNDKIYLKKIPLEISSIITTESKRIIGDATFTKSKPITSAEYKYPYSFTEEEIKIKAENKSGELYTIYFDQPTEIVSYPSDVEIKEKSYNHIKFIAKNPDTVFDAIKITFLKTSEEILNLNISNNTSKQNNVVYDNFELRGDGQIINNIAKYIQSEGTIKAKIILNDEKVGDLISIETAYDGTYTGIITSMNIHFGYQDTADIEVLEWKAG